MTWKELFRTGILVGALTTSVPVHPTIYKLEDHVNRVTIYSNVPIRPTPVRAADPRTKAVPAVEENEPQRAPVTVIKKSAGKTPTDYLHVSPHTQKTRDSERLAILARELEIEQAALAQALSRHAAVDDIYRYNANIEALKREIANAR